MYKEAAEANDSDIQMEDLGKFSSNRPSSLQHLGYEDEDSRQYSDRKEGIEYRDMNSQEEHTPSQPYEYSGVEHQQKVTAARPLGQFQCFVSMYIMAFVDNMARINRFKWFFVAYLP